MRRDLERSLLSKYPKLLERIDRIDCDNGWYDLIDCLCCCVSDRSEMLELDVRVVQIKEKYGGLRFIAENCDDHTHGMISFSEVMSYRICERCSFKAKPSMKRSDNIKTYCIRCNRGKPNEKIM